MAIRKCRIYVAGRMRGVPYFAFPAFDAARDRLLALGFDVVSPADIDRSCGFDAMTLPATHDWNVLPDGLDLDEIMARDIDALDSCDAIYLITDGIEKSDGAQKEIAHAKRTGKVFFRDTDDDYLLAMHSCCDEPDFAPPPSRQVSEPAPSASVEIRVTDPVTGGQKGAKPAMFDQIPAESLWELAELYGYGAKKYAADNWRKGYAWRLSFSAVMRHLWAFWRGEDRDPESGFKHVTHAAWHCLALAWFLDHRRSHDDRQATLEAKA